MYRVNVLTPGKYNNVKLGFRYCITKKSAKKMINDFMEIGCSIKVEKLIRITGDIYCWSDYYNDVCDYYNEKVMEQSNEYDEPDNIDYDCGFDPYMGCFSDDC